MESDSPEILLAAIKIRLLNVEVRMHQLAQLAILLEQVVIGQLGDLWHEIVIPYHLIPRQEDKDRLEEIFGHEMTESDINEMADVFSNLFASEREELLQVYPYFVWSALFVSAYYVLEKELDVTCNYLHTVNSYDQAPSDLRDRGITRSRNYLRNVANVDFPDNTREWNEIAHYNGIRNLIAHNGGIIDESNLAQQVSRYAQRHDHLDIDELSRIQFSHQFVLEAFQTFGVFARQVLGQLFPGDDLLT